MWERTGCCTLYLRISFKFLLLCFVLSNWKTTPFTIQRESSEGKKKLPISRFFLWEPFQSVLTILPSPITSTIFSNVPSDEEKKTEIQHTSGSSISVPLLRCLYRYTRRYFPFKIHSYCRTPLEYGSGDRKKKHVAYSKADLSRDKWSTLYDSPPNKKKVFTTKLAPPDGQNKRFVVRTTFTDPSHCCLRNGPQGLFLCTHNPSMPLSCLTLSLRWIFPVRPKKRKKSR